MLVSICRFLIRIFRLHVLCSNTDYVIVTYSDSSRCSSCWCNSTQHLVRAVYYVHHSRFLKSRFIRWRVVDASECALSRSRSVDDWLLSIPLSFVVLLLLNVRLFACLRVEVWPVIVRQGNNFFSYFRIILPYFSRFLKATVLSQVKKIVLFDNTLTFFDTANWRIAIVGCNGCHQTLRRM